MTYSENEPTGTVTSGERLADDADVRGELELQVLRWLTASLDYTYIEADGGDVFNQSASEEAASTQKPSPVGLFATY